jgi:hypothetical protein
MADENKNAATAAVAAHKKRLGLLEPAEPAVRVETVDMGRERAEYRGSPEYTHAMRRNDVIMAAGDMNVAQDHEYENTRVLREKQLANAIRGGDPKEIDFHQRQLDQWIADGDEKRNDKLRTNKAVDRYQTASSKMTGGMAPTKD